MKSSLLLFFLLFLFYPSFSQLSFVAANGENTAGTYTDLGANGSVITTPNFDDANSAAQNIGFSFGYNGANFTQFVLNTNGVIKLGAVAPASAGLYSAINSAETNLIYPLSMDLDRGTNPEYRVYTSGTAPNRVCTIQFKNVRDYFEAPATAPQFLNMDFQVKLYETTNNIEFVYGTFVAGGAASAIYFTEAGIKGSSAANSVNVSKASASAWSTGTFINGTYAANAVNEHNIRNSALPDAGRTYRFVSVALPATDARVTNVYTLAKLPLSFGSPHTVTAMVNNSGTNALVNLDVTLNVTGANSFTNVQTIALLAPGASTTVTFAGYSPANLGTNMVTVSVPADGDNTNNSVAASQEVNNNNFSYADNTPATGSVGYDMGAGLILNRYQATGDGYVTNVNVFIPNSINITGNTVYAVVLDNAGNIIAQSANIVIAAGDLGSTKVFPISTPPLISNNSFFVGLAQTANATTGYYPVGYQVESPVRTGAYYTAPLAAGVITQNTAIGRFMIEAVISVTPLPLTLTGFVGRIQENNSYLNWTTSYESNTDRFEIEKSGTGTTDWVKIGTVAAMGNANTLSKYAYTDKGITSGKWFYRLKMIDKDGKFTYSPVIVLQSTAQKMFVLQQNYPNPVKDITMIRYELGRDAVVLFELYGMDGRKIMSQQKGNQSKGAYTISLDAKSLALPPGKYLYRMVIKELATGEANTLVKEMNVTR